MYYLLAIYLTIALFFFIVAHIDASKCTTTKLNSNDWAGTIVIALLWPIAIPVSKSYIHQGWAVL